MKISHHLDFLFAILIVAIIAVLAFAMYGRMIRLSYVIGPYRFTHWLSIIGTIYIALATPLFALLKRQFHANYIRLLRFHIFGNIAFFGLISIHFASQMGRAPASYPALGTGIAMFIAMSLQVASGFTQRFRSQRPIYQKLVNAQNNRFFHASLIMVFYVVIVFHVMHGIGIT
jgi:hypothetical protein